MAEIFGLLKELTSRTPKKNIEKNEVVDKNVVKLSEVNAIEPKEEVDMKKEVGDGTNNEPVRNTEEEIIGDGIEVQLEILRSQPVRYYLKHKINEKMDEGLIGAQRYNDSLLATCLGIAEDVLVEIPGYIYPIDFVILDVKEDKKKPFILGTPFLTTAKAEIRFDKGTITLKSGKKDKFL
ncbi:retrovirus-related pol polyprotein from transposon TNT 1-94 [Tanacetum coccineum]